MCVKVELSVTPNNKLLKKKVIIEWSCHVEPCPPHLPMKLTILPLSGRTNGEIVYCASEYGQNRSHAREMRPSSSPDSSSNVRPSQLHNAMHPRASRGPAAHATPWMHAYPWEPVMRWWSRFPTLRRWLREKGCTCWWVRGSLSPVGMIRVRRTPRGFCQHRQYAAARWTNVDENGPVGTEVMLNVDEDAFDVCETDVSCFASLKFLQRS